VLDYLACDALRLSFPLRCCPAERFQESEQTTVAFTNQQIMEERVPALIGWIQLNRGTTSFQSTGFSFEARSYKSVK